MSNWHFILYNEGEPVSHVALILFGSWYSCISNSRGHIIVSPPYHPYWYWLVSPSTSQIYTLIQISGLLYTYIIICKVHFRLLDAPRLGKRNCILSNFSNTSVGRLAHEAKWPWPALQVINEDFKLIPIDLGCTCVIYGRDWKTAPGSLLRRRGHSLHLYLLIYL
jgi:hypothetical protein